MRVVAAYLLVLLPALTAPFLGYWALAVTVVLCLLVWKAGGRPSARPLAIVAVVAGLFGGFVCAASAALALAQLGGNAAYSARAPLGGLALVLALTAMLGGLMAIVRPAQSAVLLAFGAGAGTIAISLFYLNTPYPLGATLCLIGAVLALNAQASLRERR